VAWSEVLELSFPLLSDWNGEAISGFGVEMEDYRGFRGVAHRSAFLIDSGGTVRGAWRYATDEVPDVDELLSAVRALLD
jgi:peroxiredoxin